MKKTKNIILIIFIINFFLNQEKVNPQELKSKLNNFVIICGDKVNVRAEPNVNAKVLECLSICKDVILLKKSGKKEKIGKIEGKWAYIDTRYYKDDKHEETLKGWVFDYYLADLKNFKRVTSFIECKIEGWSGDYLLSYKFYKDGTYKRKKYDYKSRKIIDNIRGEVYRYRDIIAAHDEKDAKNLAITFYFTSEGVLCSPVKDWKTERPLCCKKD